MSVGMAADYGQEDMMEEAVDLAPPVRLSAVVSPDRLSDHDGSKEDALLQMGRSAKRGYYIYCFYKLNRKLSG